MPYSAPKILLTGPPGCGKTTAIRKVVRRVGIPARGFYTQEVRDSGGKRIGFDVVAIDGKRGPIARIGVKGPEVGRYGVDLRFLEKSVLPFMSVTAAEVAVIDEIGRMECLSPMFISVVRDLLGGSAAVLGTIALRGASFIREVRSMPGIEFMTVTGSNRDQLAEEIVEKMERLKDKG
jgi:nucleoside-triphosphatase